MQNYYSLVCFRGGFGASARLWAGRLKSRALFYLILSHFSPCTCLARDGARENRKSGVGQGVGLRSSTALAKGWSASGSSAPMPVAKHSPPPPHLTSVLGFPTHLPLPPTLVNLHLLLFPPRRSPSSPPARTRSPRPPASPCAARPMSPLRRVRASARLGRARTSARQRANTGLIPWFAPCSSPCLTPFRRMWRIYGARLHPLMRHTGQRGKRRACRSDAAAWQPRLPSTRSGSLDLPAAQPALTAAGTRGSRMSTRWKGHVNRRIRSLT